MFWFTLLFSVLPLLAQDEPLLKGIVLVGDETELLSKDELSNIEGIWSVSPAIPGSELLLETLLKPLLGQPLDDLTFSHIKEQLLRYYEKAGIPSMEISATFDPEETHVIQILVRNTAPPAAPVEPEPILVTLEAQPEPEPILVTLAHQPEFPSLRGIVILPEEQPPLAANDLETASGIWIDESAATLEQTLEERLTPILGLPLNEDALAYIEEQLSGLPFSIVSSEEGIVQLSFHPEPILVTLEEQPRIVDLVAQPEPEPLVVSVQMQEPLPFVRAIVLRSPESAPINPHELDTLEGIWLNQISLPTEEQELLSLLEAALDHPLEEETIAGLKEQITAYYRNALLTVDVEPYTEGNVLHVTLAETGHIPAMRGIVLLEDNFLDADQLAEKDGVWVQEASLEGEQEALNALLEPSLGKPLDEASLAHVKEQILDYYSDAGVTLNNLLLEADPSGVVQILVQPVIAAVPVETILDPIARSVDVEPVHDPIAAAEAEEEEEPFATAEAIEEEPVEEEFYAVEEEVPDADEPAYCAEMPLDNDAEIQPHKLLKSILLVSNDKNLVSSKTLQNLEGVQIADVKLPDNEAQLNAALAPLLNQPFTEDVISQISDCIYEFYRDADRPFVLVSTPQQDFDSGVAQLVVQESTLGQVNITGNRWTSSHRYADYFQLEPGQPISQNQLKQDVNFMNRNPYRYVNVIYSPGEKELTTDLTLEVSDRKPYFFYAGGDNVGVETTGRGRIFAGFSWDQMFGLDQTFFYQYTTNPQAARYHSNAFQYTIMLPSQTILNLYGGLSFVQPQPYAELKNSGTNSQVSIRFTAPFLEQRLFSQEISVGGDWKNTNNTVEFSETDPTFGQTVNLTQLVLAYHCKYQGPRYELEGGVDFVGSPAEFLPNQSNADFASLRPFATHSWFYANFNTNIRYSLPHTAEFLFRARGIISPSVLLPSEQLGIGGWDTVRGFDERQYNADIGTILNFELHSPRFTFFKTANRSLTNQAYLLAFIDGGTGIINASIPNTPFWNTLISSGLGFRYYLGTYLNARVDYGFKLLHKAPATGGIGQLHFSISGSY